MAMRSVALALAAAAVTGLAYPASAAQFASSDIRLAQAQQQDDQATKDMKTGAPTAIQSREPAQSKQKMTRSKQSAGTKAKRKQQQSSEGLSPPPATTGASEEGSALRESGGTGIPAIKGRD
jgi:hypothetical protein